MLPEWVTGFAERVEQPNEIQVEQPNEIRVEQPNEIRELAGYPASGFPHYGRLDFSTRFFSSASH